MLRGAVPGAVRGEGEGAEGAELWPPVEAAGEQAGVDGESGRGWGWWDDGDAEDVADVGAGEVAAVFGHQDDGFDAGPRLERRLGQGDVAGPTEDGVVLARERVNLARRSHGRLADARPGAAGRGRRPPWRRRRGRPATGRRGRAEGRV